MTRSTRFALLAGATLAALAIAGCQSDDATLAGPPSARITHPGAASVPTPGTIPAPRSTTLRFSDSYGHTYGVSVNDDGSSTHSYDGAVYEQVTPLSGGSNLVYISDGSVITQQFMAGAAPAGLPAIGDRVFQPHEPSHGRPMAMQLIPCADQINLYILASSALVAAGARLQLGRNAFTISAFGGAVAAWFMAWNNLYECEVAYNAVGASAPVTPR